MAQTVIENPIINSPFEEPRRHFRFDEEGITNEIVERRRASSYFMPVAQPKKRGGKQTHFDTEWTKDRVEENKHVNGIRERVRMWRLGGYMGVTNTTRELLEYWTNPERERKLFFCQIEALETIIYLTEVAKKFGDAWIENHLREANEQANPGLPRVAMKMATGSGKTVVMAMLIAWHTLNKVKDRQDPRFSDTFLIITPGITIRDRLRVLLPNDPDNYYRQRDILPPHALERLGQAKIHITNFHAFKLREKGSGASLTKKIAGQPETGANKEMPNEMVRRVCRDLGNKKNIVVINDEAHHCYRRKPDGEEVKLTGDERMEAKKRDEYARVWISGIEAVKRKIGVKNIYDLSATPFFLRGSGYPEGTLFRWVVSDFSLIDAIESGIVKVPRVPVADDTMKGDMPAYRDLWLNIREELPKKGRGTEAIQGEPKLPKALEGALHSLYGNYERYYRRWEQDKQARARGLTPPVFIVVCNNTNVSKLVFDYVAGWEKPLPNGETRVVPGRLDIFSNEEDGRWTDRPNSILVDSEQLESGESMSADFKKIAAREIDEFKAEYRQRFPGRDPDKISDEDLLREVMNTVGKAGKLGENVKCVVSVSMLTEGWDANTVTHILGVRAFGTQLLCEQVVGRALRRMSYAADAMRVAVNGKTAEFQGFPPEYAEVYGVPFSFIPCSGSQSDPKPGPVPTRVRALEDRQTCEIRFPRLLGYRYDVGVERISARFTKHAHMTLGTEEIPTKIQLDPIVGERSIHDLDRLRKERLNTVAFTVARRTLEKYFRDESDLDEPAHGKPWLFPQVLQIVKDWLRQCLHCKGDAFPQLLLLSDYSHAAADRIYNSIVAGDASAPRLMPIVRPYDPLGSTRYVDFDTTRPVYATDPGKCHVSHVVADTESWEQKMAQTLEDMDEVKRYVKNHNLGFTIPYTLEGKEKNYTPDFIACVDDGRGPDDLLNLVIEVTGEKRKEKAAKAAAAAGLWTPAVNNHGGFGRWAFIEITDPWDAKRELRAMLKRDAARL